MYLHFSLQLAALFGIQTFYSCLIYKLLIMGTLSQCIVGPNYFASSVENILVQAATNIDYVHSCHINDIKT